MNNDNFFKYYPLLCFVIIVLVAFAVTTINRTQCIAKFDTIAEIEKCMRLVN